MGTRFMCTVEAPIHINIKEAIVKAQETDTNLVLRKWRNTSRLFKNEASTKAYQIENDPKTTEFKDVQPYVSGQRGRQVFINGDKDFGVSFLRCEMYEVKDLMLTMLQVWTAGQVVGLINDIPTCADLVSRIESEAVESLKKAQSLIVEEKDIPAKL